MGKTIWGYNTDYRLLCRSRKYIFLGCKKRKELSILFFYKAHFKSDAVSIIKYCFAVCYLDVMHLEFLSKLKQHCNLKWPYYNIPLHTGGKKWTSFFNLKMVKNAYFLLYCLMYFNVCFLCISPSRWKTCVRFILLGHKKR